MLPELFYDNRLLHQILLNGVFYCQTFHSRPCFIIILNHPFMIPLYRANGFCCSFNSCLGSLIYCLQVLCFLLIFTEFAVHFYGEAKIESI